ncbi:MAG: hypothetical protein ABIC40_06560, partial [bacterium]
MLSEFVKTILIPNAWRYFFVLLACFTFAFFKTCTGSKWYRAEATLAFKNRSDIEGFRQKIFSQNPLPIFFDTKPVEDAYDYQVLLYSKNMVKRVLEDDFEEIYEEGDYDGEIDFYNKFMAMLGYEYDNVHKIVHLSYTYKDPEKAARFCNMYAKGLEDFMVDQVEKTHISKKLRERLIQARKEADKQTEEV